MLRLFKSVQMLKLVQIRLLRLPSGEEVVIRTDVLIHLGRIGMTVTAVLALAASGAALESLDAARAATASGTWAPATELMLPSNASTTNGSATLFAVSCPSAGDCTAVGSYVDSSGADQAMVATETSGTWAPATELTLPPNAWTVTTPVTQDARLSGVSCPSAGNCTAVGGYRISSGAPLAMVATETSGTWAPATELTLPSNTSAVNNTATFSGVSCPSAGNCTAVGPYVDSSLADQVMVATETSGTWAPATELTLPSNTSPDNSSATLSGVSCASAGNCTAVGSYRDTSGYTQALAITQTSGTWAPATELALPSNAVTGQDAFADAVSCWSSGNCAAVGSYIAEPGYAQALALTETSSTWTPATEMTLTPSATAAPYLDGIFCLSIGNCTAVGNYAADNNTQPIVATETSGAWAQAVGPILPSNAKSSYQLASFYGISCPSLGNCAAVGSYLDNSGQSQAMVATETSATSTTTALSSSLNPAAEGQTVVYTATVSPVPIGGTISFTDGGSAISNCTLLSANTGTATCTVSYARTGVHAIAASYSGADGFSSSTSSSLSELVSPTSCAAARWLPPGHSRPEWGRPEGGRPEQPHHRHIRPRQCEHERGHPNDGGRHHQT